jgi:hypothetical protein
VLESHGRESRLGPWEHGEPTLFPQAVTTSPIQGTRHIASFVRGKGLNAE